MDQTTSCNPFWTKDDTIISDGILVGAVLLLLLDSFIDVDDDDSMVDVCVRTRMLPQMGVGPLYFHYKLKMIGSPMDRCFYLAVATVVELPNKNSVVVVVVNR